MIDHIKLTGTTNSSGALTVTASMPVHGYLLAVEWIDGDLADGVDFTLSVTGTSSGVDRTLLADSDVNDDAWYSPRTPAHDSAGDALTFDSTEAVVVRDIIFGTLKLVIASGGDTKTGGCVVYFER